MRGNPPAVAVLDNEAAQAIADLRHPKHQRVADALVALGKDRVRVLVPTAVRVEARLARAGATGLGRYEVEDVTLTATRAERAIVLSSGVKASTVDATVAQCAEEYAAAGALVTVYTSDVGDLEQLCGRAEGRIAVRRI